MRAVSPPRIELGSTLAARALRPPARPPTLRRPARRRPRRAPARAARALLAARRRRRGEPALPTLTPARARVASSRVAVQVRPEWEGKELRGWCRAMGAPGSLYLHLCRGARVAAEMVQVMTAAYVESDEPSANNMTEHPVGTP